LGLNKRPKKTFKLVGRPLVTAGCPEDIQSVQVTGASGLNPALALGKGDQKCNKAFAIRKVQYCGKIFKKKTEKG
jgi:hypothetical protein